MTYPVEVQSLHDAIFSLSGIGGVKIEKFWLGDLTEDTLSLSGPYAFLPHAALRRTQGGLSDELLLRIWCTPNETPEGWRAIELLASIVRDNARAGENIQMLAIAFPVLIGGELQTETLSFVIDLFYRDSGNDNDKFLLKVAELAKNFDDEVSRARELSTAFYGDPRSEKQSSTSAPSVVRHSFWQRLFAKRL